MKFVCSSRPCSHRFTDDKLPPRCPKCNQRGTLQEVALVHLLVEDDAGPITGQLDIQYRVLCGQTGQPHKGGNIFWTGQRDIVTCDECLKLMQGEAKK